MRSTITITTGLVTAAVLVLGGSVSAQAADTTTDVSVVVSSSGSLSLTTQGLVRLSTTNPGETAMGYVPGIEVHDTRTMEGNWTVSASVTDFTSGTDIIPAAGNFSYNTPVITSKSEAEAFDVFPFAGRGPSVVVHPRLIGSTVDRFVVWDAPLMLQVPANTAAGSYVATLTHSIV